MENNEKKEEININESYNSKKRSFEEISSQDLKILGNFPDTKTSFLSLKHQEKDILMIIQKPTFQTDEIGDVVNQFFKENSSIITEDNLTKKTSITKNSDISIQYTYPASKQLIDKFTPAKTIFVKEDKDMYEKKTTFFIKYLENEINEKKKIGEIPWIEKIINGTEKNEKKLEDQHLYLEDQNGKYVLAPNPKWNTEVKDEMLYLLLFKFNDGKVIKSVRDISDYQELEDVDKEVIEILSKRFSLDKNQIVGYVHYHPTDWWLHIHYGTTGTPSFGDNNSVFKAIWLLIVFKI
jgi:hypothetical protein